MYIHTSPYKSTHTHDIIRGRRRGVGKREGKPRKKKRKGSIYAQTDQTFPLTSAHKTKRKKKTWVETKGWEIEKGVDLIIKSNSGAKQVEKKISFKSRTTLYSVYFLIWQLIYMRFSTLLKSFKILAEWSSISILFNSFIESTQLISNIY